MSTVPFVVVLIFPSEHIHLTHVASIIFKDSSYREAGNRGEMNSFLSQVLVGL